VINELASTVVLQVALPNKVEPEFGDKGLFRWLDILEIGYINANPDGSLFLCFGAVLLLGPVLLCFD